MKVNNFETWLLEKMVHVELMKMLHEGCLMTTVENALNEGTISRSDYELDRLVRNSESRGETPIIKEFIPEVKALIKKFADSGQSGGSAPFTTAVIVKVIEKLLKQEPLGGIENTDDEWNSLSDFGDDDSYQNNRLSSVFKDGNDGKGQKGM